MTKRPEMKNADDGEAVPCCRNEENSPTKAGGTDGFIGSYPGREASGFYPPTTTLPKHFSSYPPPRTYPVVAPIFCAGNYGLFTPGCIGYRAAAPPGGDIFSGSDYFQRLTDVYNRLDH